MKDYFQFLKEHKLFSDLTDAQISKILSLCLAYSFGQKEVIIYEGDAAQDIYIIIEGEVEVLKEEEESQNFYRIVVLSAGAVLGEMSLVEDTPRAATIRTLVPTTILSIPIMELRAFVNSDSLEIQLIYYKLVEKISHELCARLRSANQTMVEALHKQVEAVDLAHSSFFTKMWSL